MDPLSEIPDAPPMQQPQTQSQGPSAMRTRDGAVENVKALMQPNPHFLAYQTAQAQPHQQYAMQQQQHALQQQQMMMAYQTAANQQQQQMLAYQTAVHQQQLAAYQTAAAQQQVALYNGASQNQMALYNGLPQQQVALYSGNNQQLALVPAMEATRVEHAPNEYRVKRSAPNTRVSDSAKAFGPLEDRLKQIAAQKAAQKQ